MHIPDGFINLPTAAATGALSAGGVAYALRTAKSTLDERRVPIVALSAAFIFAVQMLNFPVGLGTSGHLLGGALAAILLGPWLACVVLAVVLAVQALFFADGGITALGANISLMSLVAGVGGYWLFRALTALLPRGRRGFLVATAVTSWTSVVAASAVAAVYLLLRGFPGEVFAVMIGLHALIGVGEAAITTTVVSAVLASRPDLVATADLLPAARRRGRDRRRSAGFLLAGLGVTLLLAVGLSSFADPRPDGLESSVLKTACDGDAGCLRAQSGDPVFEAAPLPDYRLTPLSGALGVAATFTLGAGVVMAVRGGRRERRAGSAADSESERIRT